MSDLTVDQFKKALPPSLKNSVNTAIADKINDLLADPDLAEHYRDNLLSYAHVMKEGKFKLSNYVDAVKYVSHKLMGKTNIAAFTATFPQKIQDWTAQGVVPKDIASYVSAYHKSKLVGLLLEQTIIPAWVLNQDMYQEALNAQATLMRTAKSEKVRSDAANSILTHLKQPETAKVELDVKTKEDSSIEALRQATQALVAQQREALRAGVFNAQEVAHSRVVIEGQAETVDE